MKVDFRKVDGVLTFEADGTPEELALFAILAGFSVSNGGFVFRGPKGDKGDTGPAGPQGPVGAGGIPYEMPSVTASRGCMCPAGAELGCGSSGCPRRSFQLGIVTCSTSSVMHPSYGGTALYNGRRSDDPTV